MKAGESGHQQDRAPGSCGLGEPAFEGSVPGNLGFSSRRRHLDGEEGCKERKKEKEPSHDALPMVEKKHGVQFTSPWWARTAECWAYDPAGAEAAFAAAWILRSASSSRGSKP